MTVYKVSHISGKFTHIKGKKEAIQEARRMVYAGADVSEKDLVNEWGVRINKVSDPYARSVGL